jgi:hypothetical protein
LKLQKVQLFWKLAYKKNDNIKEPPGGFWESILQKPQGGLGVRPGKISVAERDSSGPSRGIPVGQEEPSLESHFTNAP